MEELAFETQFDVVDFFRPDDDRGGLEGGSGGRLTVHRTGLGAMAVGHIGADIAVQLVVQGQRAAQIVVDLGVAIRLIIRVGRGRGRRGGQVAPKVDTVVFVSVPEAAGQRQLVGEMPIAWPKAPCCR